LTSYIVQKSNNDQAFANDILISNNMIDESLLIKFGLTIFEQILVVINLSYIIGMLWLIQCSAVEDFLLDTEFSQSQDEHPEEFLNMFGVVEMNPAHMAVSMMYFSFTSLSTVGFGDYYPVSNIERVTGAIILLFGVACFSYIMGELINAITEHKAYYEELDEIDTTLSQFFGILKKFNHNEDLESKL
jgi:hypothetical protein